MEIVFALEFVGDGLFELIPADTELGPVGTGQLGEIPGCRAVRGRHRGQGYISAATGQPAIANVL